MWKGQNKLSACMCLAQCQVNRGIPEEWQGPALCVLLAWLAPKRGTRGDKFSLGCKSYTWQFASDMKLAGLIVYQIPCDVSHKEEWALQSSQPRLNLISVVHSSMTGSIPPCWFPGSWAYFLMWVMPIVAIQALWLHHTGILSVVWGTSWRVVIN